MTAIKKLGFIKLGYISSTLTNKLYECKTEVEVAI